MGATPQIGRLSLDSVRTKRCHHADEAEGTPCLAPHPAPPAPATQFLDALPDSIVQLHLLPALAAEDKRALRAASPHARALLNACVSRVRLAAGDLLPPDRPGAAAPRLGRRFPALRAVEAYDCNDAPVSDEGLVAFLGGCREQLLSQLAEFDVKRCHYVGRPLLTFLRDHCPGIRKLKASRWTDNVTLQAIGRLPGLQELDLSDSDSVDDAGLIKLTGLTGLRALSLQRCRWIGDAGCRTLAQITTLEDLNLSSTDVGAPGLSDLSRLPRLRRLDLSGSRRVDDSALLSLSCAPALEELRLSNTEVHSAGLAHLGGVATLRSLDLGSRFELDDGGLESLAACACLSSLAAGSFNLSRLAPPGFGAALCRLTFGGGFANKGLEMLFPLPRLRSLHATGIDTVTDRVMRTVSSQTSLEELSLRSGYSLTQDGLMALHSLANLGSLSVCSCPAISPCVLAAFAGKHARLSGGGASAAAPPLARSTSA